MADELLNFESNPAAKQLIAGWRRQWSDGGEISGGLPRYLISKLGATQIGEMGGDCATDPARRSGDPGDLVRKSFTHSCACIFSQG